MAAFEIATTAGGATTLTFSGKKQQILLSKGIQSQSYSPAEQSVTILGRTKEQIKIFNKRVEVFYNPELGEEGKSSGVTFRVNEVDLGDVGEKLADAMEAAAVPNVDEEGNVIPEPGQLEDPGSGDEPTAKPGGKRGKTRARKTKRRRTLRKHK